MTPAAELGYGWLLMVIVAALTWYGIRTYHQRELARIETAQIELEGYAKLALAKITFAWQCPHCGVPLLTREGLQAHQSESSACARQVQLLAIELDRLEREAAREPAEYSMSATLVPDESVTTPDVPELES
jgi:hypothetical protein